MKLSQVLFLLFCSLPITVLAELSVPKLISDGVVLQRDANLPIWGWADPNEQVTIKFNGIQKKTNADSDGKWQIVFPKMKAGGPFRMKIIGEGETISIKDILIGDVWLCTGQSNMVHQLDIHDILYAQEINTANFDQIRHFKVPTTPAFTGPLQDVTGGTWQKALGEQVRSFSGVAYFFAKQIHLKHGIPIGLINASVGGTPIEAWIPEVGFKNFPDQLQIIRENKDTAFVNPQFRQQPEKVLPRLMDKGLIDQVKWYEERFKPINWRRINIPGYWEDQGLKGLNGTVWYRKEIELPKSFINGNNEIHIGRIVDADEVYINGTKVGGRTYKYPQRIYEIPYGLLREGKNLFVIRVTNYNGKGGFVSDKRYKLYNQQDTIDLKGYWQYKVGEVFEPVDQLYKSKPNEKNAPRRIRPQREPASLFNGMIAPYTHLPIKGVLWYQGESNTADPAPYEAYQIALIKGIREVYNNNELPFIYAQLPGFMDYTFLPVESNWAHFRDVQRRSATEKNSFMTVNIDLGEWNDIHPDNKKDVGERMALVARKLAYCEDIVYSGPLVKDAIFDGNQVVLSFDHVESGLVTNDGQPLSEFAVAGIDGKYVWADAEIIDNQVRVTSNLVESIQSVRYAWADNPDNPNLYNKDGLPASPFQMNR